MKIAVIITGGTILSAPSGGFISLCEDRKRELLELIASDVELEVYNPYTVLSEQLDGKLLSKLIATVSDVLKESFDGIIVIHGTDTLQYSAAALSLAYADSKVPIVLVSSNYTLDNPKANGRDNLKYAVEFVKETIGGVFVSYRNLGQNPEIHLGSRVLPHISYGDEICSLGGSFGYFENGGFVRKLESFETNSIGGYELSERCPILYLKAYPSMTLPKTDGYKAVLIETYHSGTLPTENEDFAEFCKSCPVPVYVTGVSDRIPYSSTSVYGDLGLKILPQTSPIYAFVNLWQKYS